MHKFSFAQTDYYSNPNKSSANPVQLKVDSLNNIAHGLFLNFPDSAHQIAANALLLSEKSNYALGKGISFLNLGSIYWSQSYYPISLFYLKSAITSLPKDKPLFIADGYRSLGRTYADLKNYNQALRYLDTALNFAGKDAKRLADVYCEQAYVYYTLRNYDKALMLIKVAINLDKEINSERDIAVLYGHLGSIYLHMAKYSTALAYEDTAFAMSIRLHNRRLHAYVYVDNAVIYNKMGNYAKAIDCAQKAIALADSIGVMDAETRAYDALVNSYELSNQLKTALNCQRKFNMVKDSLNTVNKLKTITLIQNYYDLNAKMKEVALMQAKDKVSKAKIKSQHEIIITLVLSIFVLSVILFATYYFYKQKTVLSNKFQQQHMALLDQKQLIEEQTGNLKAVNNLKDKLLAVIGHDLRTPVANLSNIVAMFEAGYLSADEVKALMKQINPIVKGAELTLSNLVEWAGSQIRGRRVQISNVDLFLLGVEMEQTFAHALHLKNLDFTNKAYPGQRVLADENHLKVILRNLISNAIKFTAEKGTIILSTEVENGQLMISVEDSGKGMSADEMDKLFYLNTHFSNSGTSGEKGTGIGLILCKELVELNGGTLSVKSTVGKGSVFYFNLPLAKAYA